MTWAGVLVIAGSVWAMRGMGMGRQDLILLIVGLVGLAVSLWSVAAVVLGAAVVAFRGRGAEALPAMELELSLIHI